MQDSCIAASLQRAASMTQQHPSSHGRIVKQVCQASLLAGGVDRLLIAADMRLPQVNVPKTKRAFCKGKECKKHQVHKVTQYKTGKASLYAQGAPPADQLPRPASHRRSLSIDATRQSQQAFSEALLAIATLMGQAGWRHVQLALFPSSAATDGPAICLPCCACPSILACSSAAGHGVACRSSVAAAVISAEGQ